MRILNSKKARAAITAALVIMFGTLMGFLKIDMTPEMQIQFAEFSGSLLSLIAIFYKLSQGIADAGSGGKTSANYKQPITESFEGFTDAIKGMGLELRRTRKARETKGNVDKTG